MTPDALEHQTDDRRSYDSVFTSLFGTAPSAEIYFERNPTVRAYVGGEFVLCRQHAEADGSFSAGLVGGLAIVFHGVTYDHEQSDLANYVAALRARSVGITIDQECWLRYLEVIVRVRERDASDRADRVEQLRDYARANGVLDVVWLTHLTLIELANAAASVDRVDELARQFEDEYAPNDVSRWRLTLVRSWMAFDVGDDRAHRQLCEEALAIMERIPHRAIYYEAITLREAAQSAVESDRLDLTLRVQSLLEAHPWPASVDYFVAYARCRVARMLTFHGDSDEARATLDRAIGCIEHPWALFALQLERTRLSLAIDGPSSYAADVAGLHDAVGTIDWARADKYDRVALLEVAEVTARWDRRLAIATRERFRSHRTVPERVFKFESEYRTMLNERTLSGIAEAATGNTYEAIAKLTDAVTAWTDVVDVPWRAAAAAYHLAKLTRDRAHVRTAQALLMRWPRSPMALDLGAASDASMIRRPLIAHVGSGVRVYAPLDELPAAAR